MVDKKFWLGILIIVLVFELMIFGCDSGDDPNPTIDYQLSGTVSITGTAQVGQTLTANTSNLGGNGTISYQWKRNGYINIGTNSNTYVIQAADEGSTISVTVTRSGYSGSITSTATAIVVANTLPALTGNITITGTATVGQTLTANTDSLGGTGDISYQWKRANSSTVAGANITDATASTYDLVTADEGKYITVTVTRSGNSGSVTSSPTNAIAAGPALTGTVSITGTAKLGQTLTVVTSSLGGSGTISYQWRRTNVGGSTFTDITGANAGTYLIKTDDYGRQINVVVTRSANSGSVTSSSTNTVADVMVWTQVSQNVFTKKINKIAHGSNGWVAVSEDVGISTNGRVAFSTDGINWLETDYVNLAGIYASVAYDNGKWIAVGNNGGMYSSTTGKASWSNISINIFDNAGAKLSINDIACGNGYWIVVGSGRMGISKDGVTWTSVTQPLMTTTNVYYNGLGDWMVAGGKNMITSDASGQVMQTGGNWISVDVSSIFSVSGDAIQTTAYGNRRWIVAGNNGKMAISDAYSTTSWTLIPNNPFGTGTIRAIVYANNKWIAVGSNSSNVFSGDSGNRIAVSTDGINWTSVANTGFASNQQIYAVAFADGKWIAVGDGGRISYAIDN